MSGAMRPGESAPVATAGHPAYAVVAAMLGTLIAVLPVFLLGALAALMRMDFGLSPAELGQCISAFFLTSAVASPTAGRLVDRVSPYSSLSATSLGTAVVLLLIAGAVHAPWQLLGLMAVAGIANAFAQPGTNILLVTRVPAGRRGTAFGLKQSAVPGALLIGGVSVPALAVTHGWRWVFLGCGVGCLVAVALMLRGTSRSPRPGTGGQPALRKGRPNPVRRGAISRPLVVFGFGGAFAAAATNSLGGFYVDFITLAGVPAGTAGTMLAAGSGIAILVRLAWGWRADHRPVGMRVVGQLLLIGAVGFMLLGSSRSMAVIGVGTALAFGAGWGWNGLFHYAVSQRNPPAAGASTGVTTAGLFLGGVLGPAAFGFIADHGSYGVAWRVAAGALVIGALLILLGRRLWQLLPVSA